MKTKWKFFGENVKGDWFFDSAFIASNKNGGFLFYKNGELASKEINIFNSLKYRELNVEYGHEKEITLKEALNIIKNKDKIDSILKFLKINLEPIKITEEMKSKAINDLKQSRAFNKDSAMEVSEDYLDIYNVLVGQQVIKSLGFKEKFYVSEKSV